MCIPLLPHACYLPCPSHPPWLDHSNYVWEEYKLWSSSLCNLPSFHLSSDQIFSSAPCSQTPSVCVQYTPKKSKNTLNSRNWQPFKRSHRGRRGTV
jgi:hypothetical protein